MEDIVSIMNLYLGALKNARDRRGKCDSKVAVYVKETRIERARTIFFISKSSFSLSAALSMTYMSNGQWL